MRARLLERASGSGSIIPAHASKEPEPLNTMNLAELMKDYVGSIDLGDANLSEDTGAKFTDLLIKAHRLERG